MSFFSLEGNLCFLPYRDKHFPQCHRGTGCWGDGTKKPQKQRVEGAALSTAHPPDPTAVWRHWGLEACAHDQLSPPSTVPHRKPPGEGLLPATQQSHQRPQTQTVYPRAETHIHTGKHTRIHRRHLLGAEMAFWSRYIERSWRSCHRSTTIKNEPGDWD